VPKAIFLEMMNVFDRLIQTEGYAIQGVIIEIIQRLIQSYGESYLCDDLETDILNQTLDPEGFPATAKLYYLLRLLINVFLQNVPKLSNKPANTRRSESSKEDLTGLLGLSLDTLAQLVAITPKNYRVDLLAICSHVFAKILTEHEFENTLAPRVLVSLKMVFHHFEANLEENELNALANVTCSITHTLLEQFFE
jgi:hypothetical protein